MRSERKRLWLFAILLIYVAIAVAGFVTAYIIKTYFLPQQASSTPPQASLIKKIQTPSSWKKYTNTDLKITFSYPSTDTLKASSYGFGITSVMLKDPQGNTDFQILFLPKSLAQAVGQNFDDYYSMQNNTTKTIKSPMSQDATTEKFTKIRNRTVNGLTAIDYRSLASDTPVGSQPEIGTFIAAGENLILFSTNASNDTKLEEILSSFSYTQ